MPAILRIKLVILDWAGTAVDFGACAPAQAFCDAFAHAGVPVTMAEARAPMGMAKKDHLRAMLEQPDLSRRWRAAFGRTWTPADVDALYADVTPRQIAAAAQRGQPVPGLVDAVHELRRRGVRIGGTTGYFRAAAEAAAAAAAALGYAPDASACTDDVPVGRPAPWMVYRVMQQLDVYPPAAVVKVGDTAIDIAEGKSAGCWTAGVMESSNFLGLTEAEFAGLDPADRERRCADAARQFQAAGAHDCLRSIADLPALIDRLDARLASGQFP